jgi:hypothetical protein
MVPIIDDTGSSYLEIFDGDRINLGTVNSPGDFSDLIDRDESDAPRDTHPQSWHGSCQRKDQEDLLELLNMWL